MPMASLTAPHPRLVTAIMLRRRSFGLISILTRRRVQLLNDALDRSRIEVRSKWPKMILRACADLDQFGERGKLSLRQTMRHQGHEDPVWCCMARAS